MEDDGRCRFNCRTARENFILGYCRAQFHETGMCDEDQAKEAWKQEQENERTNARRKG